MKFKLRQNSLEVQKNLNLVNPNGDKNSVNNFEVLTKSGKN
jgi:hypothetical protein